MDIDLNADLGEGGSEDEVLLGLVSSANIACGGHAGPPGIVTTAVVPGQRGGVLRGRVTVIGFL